MNQSKNDISLLGVEDDDLDAMAISRAFNKVKLANPLYRAKDGIEALEMLRGENGQQKIQKPFMLLLDLNLPRMDGHEFLHTIRKDSYLHDSIVFVLTTSSADKDKVDAYDKNVAGYIVKSNIENSIIEIIELLNCYWKTVSLPE